MLEDNPKTGQKNSPYASPISKMSDEIAPPDNTPFEDGENVSVKIPQEPYSSRNFSSESSLGTLTPPPPPPPFSLPGESSFEESSPRETIHPEIPKPPSPPPGTLPPLEEISNGRKKSILMALTFFLIVVIIGGGIYFTWNKIFRSSGANKTTGEEKPSPSPVASPIDNAGGSGGGNTENKDTDNDDLTDKEERIWGTDPNNSDTDSDGYKDGREVKNGYDPLGPGQLDSDGDGLGDADEAKYGSNPLDPDTDKDGYKDGQEIKTGHDPVKPAPGDFLPSSGPTGR